MFPKRNCYRRYSNKMASSDQLFFVPKGKFSTNVFQQNEPFPIKIRDFYEKPKADEIEYQ